MKQHPTSIIDPRAEIADDAVIGPYVIIEGPVAIGPGTEIMAHAHICGHTIIGSNNEIHMGAVIGHTPQHLGYKKEWETLTRIGDRNIFREYATVHRSWEQGGSTEIGNDNFFMGFTHVAHDCRVGNKIVMANAALVAGHVIIEDNVFISGAALFHQFVRVGRLAMISGQSLVSKDVPPYCTAAGRATVVGLNSVGLRRAGLSQEIRTRIRHAWKTLYRSGLNTREALDAIESGPDMCDEVRAFVDFIKGSKRGICAGRSGADEEEGGEE